MRGTCVSKQAIKNALVLRFSAGIVDKFFAKLRIVVEKPWRCAMKRAVAKTFLAIVVLLVAAATLLVLVPKLSQKQSQPSKTYAGVVELWNVETFEGGSGSRSAWLTGRAAAFEKLHEGLFVHVTNLSPQQLNQKLADGQTFDIVCFSRGVGCAIQQYLQCYTKSVGDVKDNLLSSGTLDGKVFALPLYAGGYFLFARKSQLPQNAHLIATALSNSFCRKVGKHTYNLQPLVCGFAQFNSPLTALAMSGGKGKIVPDENVSQYDAYEKFVANKTAVMLLGTQRDLYRLSERQKNEKIERLQCCALGGYTDLVQYLGVSSQSQNADACMDFLQFTVSEQSQKTLVNLNLFSVLEQTFYTSLNYCEMEQALPKAYVPNVFGDEAALRTQRDAALTTLAS